VNAVLYDLPFPTLILALCSTALNTLYIRCSVLQWQLKANRQPTCKHISTDIKAILSWRVWAHWV